MHNRNWHKIKIQIIYLANNIIPELSALMEPASIAGLLLLVIVIGIVISGLSTYRSVNKYLKLKLDDLY